MPGLTAGEEEIQEQQRSGENPVDIANIEDLANQTGDLWIRANEFHVDGSPTQVAAHGEVGDGGDEIEQGAQIEEEALLARLGQGPGHNPQSGGA